MVQRLATGSSSHLVCLSHAHVVIVGCAVLGCHGQAGGAGEEHWHADAFNEGVREGELGVARFHDAACRREDRAALAWIQLKTASRQLTTTGLKHLRRVRDQ